MQNKPPEQALSEYREKIDELDQQLVKILAARQKITAKVGAVKRANSQAIYVPEREASMIASRRAQAEALDLSGDLVEDVLRRMMRDSYYSQHANYSKINANINKVVIVGGDGALGKLLVNLFANSDYQTLSLDKAAWAHRASILADADLVIMAVPINQTNDLIQQLPCLPENCVLADVTSIKQEPLAAMLNVHKGPVVGLHPILDPMLLV